MPTCTGCNNSYPALSISAQCGRCTRGQGKSSTKRRTIENSPQRLGCGTVFTNLPSSICGRCTANGVTHEETLEKSSHLDASTTATALIEGADIHHSYATAQHLEKQPKNPGLQKAENYKTLKQLAHNEISFTLKIYIITI
ncbi:hypothetical protein M422DRAFT_254268 [Sphaerobolus stellatus SS14]|uniref:Uncharacterized protein n=1 Tax=Sphaerobolus stellatus (strain SS14) TaxID=990650 RepID=A0A0C9V6B5_SPHS4|nr:hypothetical protein M422DRAFT_254268 [Sphaerobolus stellatus SS14]